MTSSARLLHPARALVCLLTAPLFAPLAEAQPPSLIERGEYLARLGDCVACHTADGGPTLAGGREIATPFGVIHSTNITPDVKTGIGSYTFEQFDRAMRRGIAADGHNLYPAMPYPSFAKVTLPDMRALYAWLMHAVTPVKRTNPTNNLQWPFSLRFGLSVWDRMFVDDHEYVSDPTRSAQWNRGAYIVEGLGHCGACHTPRGFAYQEKATNQDSSNGKLYLSGSTVDAWYAPSLRHHWPAAETALFLKTGRNGHAAAYGSMTEVVHFSTQRLTDADAAAMGEYLASLSTGQVASEVVAPATAAAATSRPMGEALYRTRGGLGYVQFCAACHRLDGSGVIDFFPPLAGNSSVQADDPSSAIHVVLSGWKSAETERYPRALAMPEFSPLSDQELAEIMTFVRTAWGNQGKSIGPQDIQKMRGALKLAPLEPSGFETPRFAAMLASPKADELIRGMRLMTETKKLLPDNVGDTLTCTSCHGNGGTVAKGSPFVGISALFPSYQPRAGRVIDFKDRINGCFRRSMNGKPLDRDSPDMLAMVAYVDWMKGNARPNQPIAGRGFSKVSDTLVPDPDRGRRIYESQCALCHGRNGEGLEQADGTDVFPPLWGNASFNIGAGIARTYTAAAFVRSSMPVANTLKFPLGQSGLTDQEALDVAEYFSHMPRADFPDKVKDWPNGGRPRDARY